MLLSLNCPSSHRLYFSWFSLRNILPLRSLVTAQRCKAGICPFEYVGSFLKYGERALVAMHSEEQGGLLRKRFSSLVKTLFGCGGHSRGGGGNVVCANGSMLTTHLSLLTTAQGFS